jgi:MFS family permease
VEAVTLSSQRVFPLLWAGSFVLFGLFYLLTAVLPIYARELGVEERLIGVIVGVLSLTSTLAKPWTGWACDRYGRRPLMLAGALIFLACSLSYHWCAGVIGLLVVRSVHGIGMAMYPTANIAMTTDIAPRARRGAWLGLLGSATNFAMALGPLTGLLIARAYGFAAVFMVAALVAGAAVVLATRPRESLVARTTARFRLTAGFSRSALFPASIGLCLLAAFGLLLAFIPLYADRFGVNPGVFFAAFALVVAAVRGFGGRISDGFGRARVAATALFCAAGGLALLGSGVTFEGLIVSGVLFGLGYGVAHPTLLAWSMDGVPENERGRASATYLMAFDLGFAGGAALSGVSVAALGYGPTFVVAASVVAGAGLVVIGRGVAIAGMERVRRRAAQMAAP